ncbi:MAG: ADP-dependent NAD(P)H-hydrate dehydratase [Leucobacter sp.]
MVDIQDWQASDAARLVRVPDADSHKYSRGVLGLRTGSAAYPGAAVLGAEAAWRTGVGLVRYFTQLDEMSPRFGLPSPAAAVLAARPETVFSDDSEADRARCDAWLVGSGTDAQSRSFAETAALTEILGGNAPVVADAGALGLIADTQITSPTIITPHLGEFRKVWISAGLVDMGGSEISDPEEAALTLARHLGVTVLLKGSHTIAASPSGAIYAYGVATPWLATAGTGDVLAGILGALVATHAREVSGNPDLLAQLGATAALLHDSAARVASNRGHSQTEAGPITALDVAHALPQVISTILASLEAPSE